MVSNSLDTDQARRYVGPDLDSNSLQRLSATTLAGEELSFYELYKPHLEKYCL